MTLGVEEHDDDNNDDHYHDEQKALSGSHEGIPWLTLGGLRFIIYLFTFFATGTTNTKYPRTGPRIGFRV